MYYTSLYSCGIISLILSLTINRHNVPQIIAKFSESDHMLSAMKYGHKIDKRTILYLIIQFTVLCLSLYQYFLMRYTLFVLMLIYQSVICLSSKHCLCA
jgi:hypothetical protein